MPLKSIMKWFSLAVCLLGTSTASAAGTTAEIAQQLARSRAELTAARNDLTPEQSRLLFEKLADAERALTEYDQLVVAVGRTAAVSAGGLGGRSKAAAAEAESATGRTIELALGRVAFVFIAAVTFQSDDDPALYRSRQRRMLEEKLHEVGRAAEQVKAEVEAARTYQESTQYKVETEDDEKGDIHHIATDKNTTSSANGGPWTPRVSRAV